jgi:hypothetical protein
VFQFVHQGLASADREADALVLNVSDWWSARWKKASTAGLYMMGTPLTELAPTLFGLRTVAGWLPSHVRQTPEGTNHRTKLNHTASFSCAADGAQFWYRPHCSPIVTDCDAIPRNALQHHNL